MMAIRYEFNDVTVVDSNGNVEYVKMGDTDFFQVDQDFLAGTKVTQWYQNRSESTSTLMQAVNEGKEFLEYIDYLTTHTGRVIRQYSDTLCIMDGNNVAGAIEFAWYNPKKDVVFEPEKDSNEETDGDLCIDDYIGTSKHIMSIKEKIQKAADLTTPVFITGKTGTGKEMLARIIHNSGRGDSGEFVYVNCGALPETLLESILFGTAKGSFTGSTDKEGLFHTADGGTLFLDELNSMPISIQGKLLKAIEEKRIRKVGDDKDVTIDVRIIASCSEPTSTVIADNSLRKDLFFRLSSIQFELPSLHDRPEDIPLLCEFFLQKFKRQYSKSELKFADNVLSILINYDWPGNIRELRNIIEGAVYRAEGKFIKTDDIQLKYGYELQSYVIDKLWENFQTEEIDLKTYMRNIEKDIVNESLQMQNYDIGETSKLLGISRESLRHKIVRLGCQERAED